jgi:hypothetical protein
MSKSTTRNIAHNALGQFFAITRYADGSVNEAGPFASGEAAAAAIEEEVALFAMFDECDAAYALTGAAEFPRGEFAF